MTKKDFELIAAVCRTRLYGDLTKAQRDTVAAHFADALERTNPRFDRERFLKACGVAQ
jgi:hypothetical protein